MGPAFDRLHPAVRRFHALSGRWVLWGQVHIERPERRLGRWLARLTGTPGAEEKGPVRFELRAAPQEERWTRFFPGFTMSSRLALHGAEVMERLGPATLFFHLAEVRGGLAMQLTRMRFLGIPCPRFLLPRISAVEIGEGERLLFDVRAEVPGLGRVVHYAGYLVVPGVLERP